MICLACGYAPELGVIGLYDRRVLNRDLWLAFLQRIRTVQALTHG
jgi:hypothetical protein